MNSSKKVKTIDEVLAGLDYQTDNRVVFWKRIKATIVNGLFGRTFSMLMDHANDTDFPEQCAIAGQAIADEWKQHGGCGLQPNDDLYICTCFATRNEIEHQRNCPLFKEEPLAIIGQGDSQRTIMP